MTSDLMSTVVLCLSFSHCPALVKAILCLAQSDVDDGHQAMSRPSGAEQRVGVGPPQHCQDVPSVEAQMSWLCGLVVAQGPNNIR